MTALAAAEEAVIPFDPNCPSADAAWLEAADVAARSFLPQIWSYLIDKYQLRSVLDLAANERLSTDWFVDQGIFTLGVSAHKRRANIYQHDYRNGPFIPFTNLDLAWCAGSVMTSKDEYISNVAASMATCRFACLAQANFVDADRWIIAMQNAGFKKNEKETTHLCSLIPDPAADSAVTPIFFVRRLEHS